jgi:hypothetical protein
MNSPEPAALVDLAPLNWPAERSAAALAIAAPNNQRVAQAAAQLTLDDHAAAFAAWCDAHHAAAEAAAPGGAR